MINVTYEWLASSAFIVNQIWKAGKLPAVAIGGDAAGEHFLAAWTLPGASDQVEGRAYDTAVGPLGAEFRVNSAVPGNQLDASVASLQDGRYVVTFTDDTADPGGDIHARFVTALGVPAGLDIPVTNGPLDEGESDVAGLTHGRFVVSYTEDPQGAGTIAARVFSSTGTQLAVKDVSLGTGKAGASSVAALTDDRFVVAWEATPPGTTGKAVFFRIFDKDGNELVGDNHHGVKIDEFGANTDIQVAGLPDGGFVVAYTDTGWFSGQDITVKVFNADGSERSDFILANDLTAGAQNNPSLAVLSNGMFAVSWLDGDDARVQAFDAQGNKLGPALVADDHAIETEIVALGSSRFVTVNTNLVSGTGEHVILGEVRTLARSFIGDGAANVITGVGDSLNERLIGMAGDDILEGKGGPDDLLGGLGRDFAAYATAPTGVVVDLAHPNGNTGDAAGDSYNSIEGVIGSAFDDKIAGDLQRNWLSGGGGNDRIVGGGGFDDIDGGLGSDTAVFTHNFADYFVADFGSAIAVERPKEAAFLKSIEHLLFADVIVTPVDDGNPLFDSLYYLNQNPDVLSAGVNALDHFNASGWHEGRDPNFLFDTSGYLGANKDVAASGMNPLEHYDQLGWHQGRDPSLKFDTTLYLIHNPDVAAAGVDPLTHYLQFGYLEGRRAYDAVGSVTGGFDAEYYLFSNPDVAAAGVDPLEHFNAFGWHEGRNPNAWFETAGYLSHYGDVAASGANPLDHYRQFGWAEGRDPSARFDTLGYLKANPDVAAAHINPLDHFLTNGIYEDRQPVNDGLWH